MAKPVMTKPALTSTKPSPVATGPSKPPPLPTRARKSASPPPLPPAATKKIRRASATGAGEARRRAARRTSRGPRRPPDNAALTKRRSVHPRVSRRRQVIFRLSRRVVQTLHIAPAPPPMPKLDPVHVAPPPPEPLAKEPSSKYPTLVMFGDDTEPNNAPTTKASTEEAPPIVVPPPEPSGVTHAVTRPPPWGEGAVGIDIPKSPPVPGARESEAPRPMELSSSDLTSQARIATVKAQPLVAAERPRTMAGLGPDVLAQNRSTVEKAAPSPSPPMPPLSQSDVASTLRRPAQTDSDAPLLDEAPRAPAPTASRAKLHDLTTIARDRAQHAYADLRERTKDKPPWFLPTIAGGSAFVVLILLVAGVKAAFGTSSSGSSAASVASSAASTASTDDSLLPIPTAKVPTVGRPIACKSTGAPRDVAPKALVGSGVEVTAIGGQIALGFAVAPKEATLELLDATSLASASALHLRSNDPVRRVLALDASKAAVDSDRKGDKLQGRRTLRASPPIDVGAMDGGLAWAPHGTDKGVKLWSLADAQANIEALRGEALPSGGFAIAFRQAGAIHFGAFAGNPPAPLGGLGHAQGLGPQIGSPTIAVSGDRVMVAWADRASAADPWSVRYVSFHPGEDNAQAKAFTLPPGGLGEQAMSPSLASLGASRFLLVWTEGAVSSHQVRGVAFGDSGPTGDPFTASAEGVNAGQAQAAVVEGGRGVVAFLAANGRSFEVVRSAHSVRGEINAECTQFPPENGCFPARRELRALRAAVEDQIGASVSNGPSAVRRLLHEGASAPSRSRGMGRRQEGVASQLDRRAQDRDRRSRRDDPPSDARAPRLDRARRRDRCTSIYATTTAKCRSRRRRARTARCAIS